MPEPGVPEGVVSRIEIAELARLFGDTRMLSWLKRKLAGTGQNWLDAQQPPGKPFPFPKGTTLKPKEDVTLALPRELIADHEQIGSVLLCNDDAEFALNDKIGVYYVSLKAGMRVSLAKSCEIIVVADDDRPRQFQIMRPITQSTEQDGPANRSQPFRSETNRTSSAAGSRR